jgi:hypothetical protein
MCSCYEYVVSGYWGSVRNLGLVRIQFVGQSNPERLVLTLGLIVGAVAIVLAASIAACSVLYHKKNDKSGRFVRLSLNHCCWRQTCS